MTGPISLSTTAAIAVGRATPIAIAIMPPREVPTMMAGSASHAVSTVSTSSSSTGIE